MAAFNHQDADIAIGAPQFTSTPLPKRRPAALTFLPPADHVPTLTAVHPRASPTYIQSSYFSSALTSPYAFFPHAGPAMRYTPNYTPVPYTVQSSALPLSPTYLTSSIASVPLISDYPRTSDSSVFQTPPVKRSIPFSSSPVTETRPMDFFQLPTCSAKESDIGRAVDDMLSQVLRPVGKESSPNSDTSKRRSSLESELRALKSRLPSEVKELSAFLNFHCSAIEEEQTQCLNDGFFPADYNNWLTKRYSQQLHLVFNTVERRLHLLQNQDKMSRRKYLEPEAIGVMEKWYLEHLTNPYPTQTEAEDLANLGGITHTQVRKWFANKRHRTRKPCFVRDADTARYCYADY